MKSKKKFLKEAGVLLIFSALIFSNFFIMVNAEENIPTQTIETNKSSSVPLGPPLQDGYILIMDESFKNNTFPPDWTQNITNSAATWKIEDEEDLCHSKPYYAICYNHINQQNEWLITPSLNFSEYNEIRFSFYWMMDWWTAAHADYCDLNVCISTDGGSEWKVIWNEDKYQDPSKEFDEWEWHDTNMGDHIDLSDYAGETDVIIGFQYNGSDGCQIFLDDISIWVDNPDPDPLRCDADGPYNGSAAETIYFYGDAWGGQQPYIYRWDFGDGSPFDYRKNPTHKYYKIGVFNVSLRVRETFGKGFDINITNATIKRPPQGPPRLKILNISGGIGLRAMIKNDGFSNATEVKWEIHARGGLFNIFDKKEKGSIDWLAPGESKEIRLKYFVGFGRMHIKITAETTSVEATPRERDAFKLGPFIFGVH